MKDSILLVFGMVVSFPLYCVLGFWYFSRLVLRLKLRFDMGDEKFDLHVEIPLDYKQRRSAQTSSKKLRSVDFEVTINDIWGNEMHDVSFRARDKS